MKEITHDLNHDSTFYCTHNQFCVQEYKVNVYSTWDVYKFESLFKNFIPIHSWKFFVRQFFDQFSWFKITIKVSKWHKNGMNSIKMIKPSFTRNWSYKHSDLFLRNSFRKFTTIFLGIPNGISLHLFTRMTKIYRLHRIQNMTLQFSNEYLYFRSLCNYIKKSQNQTHLSVTFLNDG